MAASQRPATVWLHTSAPPKPAEGQPCNGCGLCCAAEPCPLGVLVSLRRQGSCRALQWQDSEQRYRCGVLARAGQASLTARLAGRWIAAGQGCDCSLTPTRSAA